MPESEPNDESADVSQSRLQLLWDVFVFQFKLALDGLRDVVLVPVSLMAALMGLLFGGDKPADYFQRVLRFGRRTEFWINLFGHRRMSGTSDEMIKPIQDKVFAEAQNRPWLRKAGSKLNESIDSVGSSLRKPESSQSKKDAD